MGRIWSIARQTIAEGIRMKVALVFIAFIAFLLISLPISLRSEDSVSSAVQTFLSFSLGGLDVLLSVLTIFLARSMSEEIAGGHIQILMAKPIPRWQFVAGKWLGIVAINVALLVFAGLGIYGITKYMTRLEPRDGYDAFRLHNEVLTARHPIPMKKPDFTLDAERLFNERLETGGYVNVADLDEEAEKDHFKRGLEQRFRTIHPMEARVFTFENVRCDRSPDKTVQIRYKAELWQYPPDEILRCEWYAGNPDLGTPLYRMPRRDVIQRYHSISVPADAVAPDRTLRVELRNRNPFEGEPQFANTISFTSLNDIELLFAVGTFGGNLIRQLSMLACKLLFLAAFALMNTCIFSYPVACLVSFSFLAICSMTGFLSDAIEFFDDEGLYGIFKTAVAFLYQIVFFLIPDFSRYDGTSMLVNGRNVTLMWVLTAVRDLVLFGTTLIGLIACILFQRREVAETSI
ncbi:MAG: ABC transporter permease [Phycisphaerae bacterium]